MVMFLWSFLTVLDQKSDGINFNPIKTNVELEK